MPRKTPCLKVPKVQGEKTIALASQLKILDNEMEIRKDKNFIYIPLVREPSTTESESLEKQVAGVIVSTFTFQERPKRTASFIDLLPDKIPPSVVAALPHSADIVGDIAIVEITPELEPYRKTIGEAILQANKNVRTVLAKAGAIGGKYRLRDYSVIAGESKTVTVHKEYGCQFHVDLAKAYFSPRLSYEHNRVASLVGDGETVVDMFAGVGPFSIRIAKIRHDVKVYAIDVNPDAVELLERNVRLNRVESKILPILGDARKVLKERLSSVADRVIMNLPENAMEFVDVACEALKPTGGIVHFYGFVTASDSLENVQLRFMDAVKKCERKVERILSSRLVRATAPYEWQAVLDARIL